jgi:hypothetical protein
MPNSTDNQDLGEDAKKAEAANPAHTKTPSQVDENNFTSDDQKGKKVDADPTIESGQPADV